MNYARPWMNFSGQLALLKSRGMEVGDEADQSAIMEMIALPGRMLIVKEQGLWQSQLADNIDPGRTNPAVPNMTQKLLPRGTTDPLVGRTLLQAKRLLKSSMLPQGISADRGMEMTLVLLTEFSALAQKRSELKETLHAIESRFLWSKSRNGGLQVPTLGDVSVRGKGFIQGADHAIRSLWQFVRVFHPELPQVVSWPKLRERFSNGTAREQLLVPLVDRLEPPFRFVRNTRNAVEHPKPEQDVILSDFRLRADGKVHFPTIEVIEKESPLSETDLVAYFERTQEMLVLAYEQLLINLSALHVSSLSGFPVEVIELEADQRRYPDVRFAYASMLGDRIMPFAD